MVYHSVSLSSCKFILQAYNTIESFSVYNGIRLFGHPDGDGDVPEHGRENEQGLLRHHPADQEMDRMQQNGSLRIRPHTCKTIYS